MTVTTISSAVDDMLKLFLASWTFGNDKVDVPNGKFTLPDVDDVWARWRLQHATGYQASLGAKKLWGRDGTVFIQVFTPLNGNVRDAYDIAELAVNAYQGKRTVTDVWFRNVRMYEPTGIELDAGAANWYQLNVFADFTYSQLR